MVVIGLTGSLSTGKSTVAQMFKRSGAVVVDADQIVHRHLNQRGAVYRKLIKTFGKQIINKGGMNRKKLAEIVFKDRRKLRTLENILHPMVRLTISRELKKLKKSKKMVVLDVPLLFESGINRLADISVVVKTKPSTQIKRAMKRLHITRTEALTRIKAQMPLKEKIRRADIIIDNNGTQIKTKEQVKDICQKIHRMKK